MAASDTNKKAKSDRIMVDNSNLSELKATCDEAVERILSRQPEDSSPAAQQNFTPFRVSHFHADLRLVLGFTAAAIMIGTSAWSYLVEKEWSKNKHTCAIAVVVYVILSAVQLADGYMQGNTIFTGTRKMLSNRIETEHLRIASPPLPKATKKGGKGPKGKPLLTPPAYTLQFEYTRKSNKGKSLLGSKNDTLPLGHLGEWFTEEGEFVEDIFEQRLLSGLQKAFGQ